MIIRQNFQDHTDIVELQCNLVLATAEETRKTLRRIIDTGTGRMVIDLSGVDMIDSSGLSAIIAALKAIDAQGGQLGLCALSPRAQAIFRLMRLNEVFQISPDMETALRSLKENETGEDVSVDAEPDGWVAVVH